MIHTPLSTIPFTTISKFLKPIITLKIPPIFTTITNHPIHSTLSPIITLKFSLPSPIYIFPTLLFYSTKLSKFPLPFPKYFTIII